MDSDTNNPDGTPLTSHTCVVDLTKKFPVLYHYWKRDFPFILGPEEKLPQKFSLEQGSLDFEKQGTPEILDTTDKLGTAAIPDKEKYIIARQYLLGSEGNLDDF